jgi:hypothetical protein
MRGRKWKKKGGGPVPLSECRVSALPLDTGGAPHSDREESLPRAGPFGTALRIEEFAVEAFSELLGVHALRKAKYVHVDVAVTKRMTARAA